MLKLKCLCGRPAEVSSPHLGLLHKRPVCASCAVHLALLNR